MSLNRDEMVVKGVSNRAVREVARWLANDLDDASIHDAEFVKAYLERQRANFGRLFEFAGIGITIFAAFLIAMAQVGVPLHDQVLSLVLGGALLAIATYCWIRGLVLDDRLDRVDNVLTAAPQSSNANLSPKPRVVAQFGRWQLNRRA